MKKLIPFIIIIFSAFILNSCFKANDIRGHEGRCTGSASCSACTSCSRCGHCGAGGTCGVCSGGSSGSSSRRSRPEKYKTPKSHTSPKAKSRKPPKVFIDKVNVNINSNNRYLVGVATVKIYARPSDQSKTIAIVTKNARLIRLEQKGEWYKVKVESGGKEGYVKRKDVK